MQGEAAVLTDSPRETGAARRLTAVALGSNEGDRHAHLSYAVAALDGLLSGMRVSPFIETAPVGVPLPQQDYLNGAVVGGCPLPPSALLAALLEIERARGRTRPYRGAPRTLDLDLIVMGDLVVQRPDVEVPHPRFRRRRFVLEPLAAIAPDLIDPVTGRTMRALSRDLGQVSGSAETTPVCAGRSGEA